MEKLIEINNRIIENRKIQNWKFEKSKIETRKETNGGQKSEEWKIQKF